MEKLKKELEECAAQKEEYLNGWKRERADFLNYKRDEGERLGRIVNISKEEIILDFLPVIDSIDLAEKKLSKDIKDHDWVKGIMCVKKLISGFLEKQGVTEIEAMGKKFNPHEHEATEYIEKKGSEPETVIEVVQKGYALENKVIRPVKVKLSK